MNELKIITMPDSQFRELKARLSGNDKFYLAQSGADSMVLFRHENFLLLGMPQNTLIRSESCKSEDLERIRGIIPTQISLAM